MKSVSTILMAITMLLSTTACKAQIKNAKTESVKIFGNCGMCKKTIEKAGNIKKVAKVDWNKDTKMASISYDSTKTSQDEILKRIALVGYDSESFLAPDDVYNQLHGCCQYERNKASAVNANAAEQHQLQQEDDMAKEAMSDTMATEGIALLYQNYFLLKDAFVQARKQDILNYASAVQRSIKAIDMNSLSPKTHLVWMKKWKELEQDASAIANEKSIEKQRSYLNRLSENVFELMKVEKPNVPTYFDHCPMANDGKGANWLSQEKDIKNPYYGTKMLGCGSIVETIK